MNAEIQEVVTGDEYIHVRFEDPEKFDTIRTPEWADKVSDSVSEGSEVRMGKMQNSDDWEVQAVLIRKNVGEDKARELAQEIIDKIKS